MFSVLSSVIEEEIYWRKWFSIYYFLKSQDATSSAIAYRSYAIVEVGQVCDMYCRYCYEKDSACSGIEVLGLGHCRRGCVITAVRKQWCVKIQNPLTTRI